MTGVGICGIFIPGRIQASPSGANLKVSNRLGGWVVLQPVGKKVVYKACRWDPCIDSVAVSFPWDCVAVVSRIC